jgi:hypothetical protein
MYMGVAYFAKLDITVDDSTLIDIAVIDTP